MSFKVGKVFIPYNLVVIILSILIIAFASAFLHTKSKLNSVEFLSSEAIVTLVIKGYEGEDVRAKQVVGGDVTLTDSQGKVMVIHIESVE